MAGTPITSDEIARARAWIEAHGLTLKTVGCVSLGRGLGLTQARANAILNKLRYPVESKKIVADDDSTDPVGSKRLQMENAALRSKLNDALSRQVLDQRYQAFVAEVAEAVREYPKWVVEKPKGNHTAMPVAHLSDWHFDEVVDPAQVNYCNAYNREIARTRLRRCFEKIITLPDEYLKGVNFPGIVLPISGDMFSGNIHPELRETNVAPITESIRYWVDEMEAGITLAAKRYGKVFVPCVVGNHGRLTQKPQAKNGPTDSFDWLLYSLLQRDFARAKDTRVQFQIAPSFDNYFRIFNTRYCQTHGDQFRGGSGISGMAVPLALGDARKRKKSQSIRLPYDFLICGHWHRRDTGRVVKVNGSGKGYDEWALKMIFDVDAPMQSFWLDTPEHKITIELPILVKGKGEGWEQEQSEQHAVFEAAV